MGEFIQTLYGSIKTHMRRLGIDIGELEHWKAFWNATSRSLREANQRREQRADEWLDEYVNCGRYGAEHIEEPLDWEASGW